MARSASPPEKHRVCVARIGAAHGTRGEVRLWPFTAEPEAVANYGPLETADGTACFEIESLRSAKDGFVVRLKGVADRCAAERLRNIELYVPRSRLPDPEPDEFYHADLIGLAAIDANGGALGTVVAVHNFGAGDILEIAPSGGDTFMIPFTAAAVPVVDIPAGRIVVDMPPDSDAGNSAAAPAQPGGFPGGEKQTGR